jgi:hypothetical protein
MVGKRRSKRLLTRSELIAQAYLLHRSVID